MASGVYGGKRRPASLAVDLLTSSTADRPDWKDCHHPAGRSARRRPRRGSRPPTSLAWRRRARGRSARVGAREPVSTMDRAYKPLAAVLSASPPKADRCTGFLESHRRRPAVLRLLKWGMPEAGLRRPEEPDIPHPVLGSSRGIAAGGPSSATGFQRSTATPS